MSTKNKSNEIKITRLYDAPVALVWDAWTDPAKAAMWWGPRGFTITTHSKDLRNGGHWHYTMHGPDGVDYPNKTIYHEVVPQSRLVYDHGGNDEQAPLFRVTVTFTEVQGKTKMDMSMGFPTAEIAMETEKFIRKVGGYGTWDRLAEYLDKKTSDRETFVINRSFDAPIDLMFEMWTNPKHFSQWLAPTGFTMEFIKADIRKGGTSFYKMSNPHYEMYGQASYIEITKPKQIVYTQQFCDKDQNLSRHPMAPTWPATMITKVSFHEEAPDRTRVTVVWEVHGPATAEERDTFNKARGGMTQGWTGSFDKLEEYIGKVK